MLSGCLNNIVVLLTDSSAIAGLTVCQRNAPVNGKTKI